MYRYRLVATYATDEGRFWFGVAVYKNHRRLAWRPAISPERQRVKAIARLCNQEQVEPVHLADVVHDMTH